MYALCSVDLLETYFRLDLSVFEKDMTAGMNAENKLKRGQISIC